MQLSTKLLITVVYLLNLGIGLSKVNFLPQQLIIIIGTCLIIIQLSIFVYIYKRIKSITQDSEKTNYEFWWVIIIPFYVIYYVWLGDKELYCKYKNSNTID